MRRTFIAEWVKALHTTSMSFRFRNSCGKPKLATHSQAKKATFSGKKQVVQGGSSCIILLTLGNILLIVSGHKFSVCFQFAHKAGQGKEWLGLLFFFSVIFSHVYIVKDFGIEPSTIFSFGYYVLSSMKLIISSSLTFIKQGAQEPRIKCT